MRLWYMHFVLLPIAFLSASALSQDVPDSGGSIIFQEAEPAEGDENPDLLSSKPKRRRMEWCPPNKSTGRVVQVLKTGPEDICESVSVVPTKHGLLTKTAVFYVVKADPKTGKPIEKDGNFVLDGQLILVSGKPGTAPLIMQMFESVPKMQYTRIYFPRGTTPPDDDEDEGGGSVSIGQRKIPAAAKPPAALQSAAKHLKDWCGKNKAAAAWLAEYFYDWKLIATSDPQLFPNVQTVRDHNFGAMRVWNKSTPNLKTTSDPMSVITSALLGVFGDNPAAKMDKAALETKLNAMVWACQ